MIVCDNAELMITRNLFEALSVMRNPGSGCRYLWVDAICIDQKNTREKGFQIPNMLTIYEKARMVVVWLGAAPLQMDIILKVAMYVESQEHRRIEDLVEGDVDDETTSKLIIMSCDALMELYTKSWFRRIWVQQKIYAARSLPFYCGHVSFQWLRLFSGPDILRESLHLTPHIEQCLQVELTKKTSIFGERKGHPSQIPAIMAAQLEAIRTAINCHDGYFKQFESFATKMHASMGTSLESSEALHASRMHTYLNFFETLVDTISLEARNPRDHIYAIIGMTKFPAKPMTVNQWVKMRHNVIFMPIDYEADRTDLYVALSWIFIMVFGLRSASWIQTVPGELAQCHQTLPSWAISWENIATIWDFMDRMMEFFY